MNAWTGDQSPNEFWTDFCVLCGRIWVNEFTGDPRRTEMFHPISKPMDGVWIGHTFIPHLIGDMEVRNCKSYSLAAWQKVPDAHMSNASMA